MTRSEATQRVVEAAQAMVWQYIKLGEVAPGLVVLREALAALDQCEREGLVEQEPSSEDAKWKHGLRCPR